jgi:hypothetical protein
MESVSQVMERHMHVQVVAPSNKSTKELLQEYITLAGTTSLTI